MPHPFFGAKDAFVILKKGGQIKIFSWGGQLVPQCKRIRARRRNEILLASMSNDVSHTSWQHEAQFLTNRVQFGYFFGNFCKNSISMIASVVIDKRILGLFLQW